MYFKKNIFAVSIAATLLTTPSFAIEITDNFEITGAIEFEASYQKEDGGKKSTDLNVSTVELGFNAQINNWVSGNLLFLFEEGERDLATGVDDTTGEKIEVDEAYIRFGNEKLSPFYLNAGRLYAPFGTYETAQISDPLTLAIGETRETALEVGFLKNNFYGSIYAFNGETDNVDSNVEHFGARLGFAKEFGNNAFDFGVDYINSIGDSKGLSETTLATGREIEKAAGMAVHALFTAGSFDFIAEYVAAQDDVLGAGTNSELTASHIEVDYNFKMGQKDATFGVSYGETEEAGAFGIPEKMTTATLSAEIYENTSLAFEIGKSSDYADVDTDFATLLLAVEF